MPVAKTNPIFVCWNHTRAMPARYASQLSVLAVNPYFRVPWPGTPEFGRVETTAFR